MGLISVEITGLGSLEALLARLEAFSISGLMKQLADITKELHERRVTGDKTTPDGAAWAALSPFTVAKKGGGDIMVDSGALAGAFTASVSDTFARISNGAAYLHFHQSGTSRMPSREIMGFSAENIQRIQEAVQAFVASRLG